MIYAPPVTLMAFRMLSSIDMFENDSSEPFALANTPMLLLQMHPPMKVLCSTNTSLRIPLFPPDI